VLVLLVRRFQEHAISLLSFSFVFFMALFLGKIMTKNGGVSETTSADV
jgi:hypothetical protein